MTRRAFLGPAALTFAVVAFGGAGCAIVQRLQGTATVDLSRAAIRRMNVALRKTDQTYCPREQTQMAVVMTAVPEGGKEEKTYETYVGRGAVNKNDRLDFAAFSFTSDQAQFDADGWMAPLQALPATAGHELVVHATYNPSPLVFTYTYKFRPDYLCITSATAPAAPGAPGGPGKDGAPGKPGDPGGVMSAAGDGHEGAPGGPGGDGAPGAPGAKVHALVTYVKTPFYERLVGIRLSGAITDLLLVHPGRPFVIHAPGGAGGGGGVGGKGGAGGVGGNGNPGGHGGNGGAAGVGGRGGSGGPGGTVEVVYDARFPDLANAVQVDVAGGPGGPGGKGGEFGPRGAGGKGTAPPNTPTVAPDGAPGRDGADGVAGPVGRTGATGAANVHAGSMAEAFAGIPDITVVTVAAPLPPAPAKPTH